MSKFVKWICTAAMICSAVSVSACSDDLDGSTEAPLIAEYVAELKDALSGCSEEAVNNAFASNKADFANACRNYKADLETVKNNPIALAYNQRNSGQYMAMYIYVNAMSNELNRCDGTAAEKFKKKFESNGCGDITAEAKKVVNSRQQDL